jgi:hypothetical protein
MGSSLPSRSTDFVTPKGVAGVDTDPNHITRLNFRGIDLFQRFIDNNRVSVLPGSGSGENEKPPRRYDANTKR